MNQKIIDKDQSINTAIGFLRSNRPLRAEEVCRNYLNNNPGCTEHLRLLSHSLMKQDRFLEAEEKRRFALSLSPKYPQLYEDLGSGFAMQSRFEEAVHQNENAIKLHPSKPHAPNKQGQPITP